MERGNWDGIHIGFTELLATRSTCARLKTAAVIVDEDNCVISSGYNGVPKGTEHCCDYWERIYNEKGLGSVSGVKFTPAWFKTDYFKKLHKNYSQIAELHAERNAILWLARKNRGSSMFATMYTLYSPCIDCAKAILQSGIKRVVYHHRYDRCDGSSLKLLKDNGVIVDHYKIVSPNSNGEEK